MSLTAVAGGQSEADPAPGVVPESNMMVSGLEGGKQHFYKGELDSLNKMSREVNL